MSTDPILISLFTCLFFKTRSHVAHQVIEDDLEPLILLAPELWNYSQVPPYLIYAVLGIEPGALCIPYQTLYLLGKLHSWSLDEQWLAAMSNL